MKGDPTMDPMADPPGEANQEALRLFIRTDPSLHGGGFTFRDGKWMVWLAVARGTDTSERVDDFRGYEIAWEDSGPFHGLGTDER